MKKFTFLALLLVASSTAFAVSMNFSGNFRTEAGFYSNLGQDMPNTKNQKQFLAGRFLLDPNLIIDDHFSVKSQWSLLTSPNYTPSAVSPLGNGMGGWVYGDVQTQAMVLNRAWLDWTSDFGVVRVGRMPVAWGYGLVFDAGNGVWDDYQTTFDRLEYRLHLGHVIGGLSYSKPRKRSVHGGESDAEYYGASLQYDNPELEVEGGILFEKQVRSSGQLGEWTGLSNAPVASPANPYYNPDADATVAAAREKVSAPSNPYPLHTRMPFPKSNNLLDVYLKKSFGYFSIGGEAAWITGEAMDYNNNDSLDTLNAWGAMGNLTYEYHKVKAFVEVLYASGDNDLTEDSLSGFVLLHRNRRPGIILGREILGPYEGNNTAMGSPVIYGSQDTFSGVYYFRPGFRVDWSPTWATGLEIVHAGKASVKDGETRTLGTEIDLAIDYGVYKNFVLGMNMAVLFRSTGIQVPEGKTIFGLRGTAALKF